MTVYAITDTKKGEYRAELISVSVALSQTPDKSARPQTRG